MGRRRSEQNTKDTVWATVEENNLELSKASLLISELTPEEEDLVETLNK
ncbi:hypothetical protein [Metasolibacillus sp. FSL K6-0083]